MLALFRAAEVKQLSGDLAVWALGAKPDEAKLHGEVVFLALASRDLNDVC